MKTLWDKFKSLFVKGSTIDPCWTGDDNNAKRVIDTSSLVEVRVPQYCGFKHENKMVSELMTFYEEQTRKNDIYDSSNLGREIKLAEETGRMKHARREYEERYAAINNVFDKQRGEIAIAMINKCNTFEDLPLETRLFIEELFDVR